MCWSIPTGTPFRACSEKAGSACSYCRCTAQLPPRQLAAVCSRLQRLQGILKAVRSTAANAEDMVRAQTAVVKLQAQLTDLQRAESELSQQVGHNLTFCMQDTLYAKSSL